MYRNIGALTRALALGTMPSGKDFVINGAGMPEPNLGRLETDPFVCFAEGDAPGGGEPTYTKSQFEAAIKDRLGQQAKKYEAQLAEMKTQIEALSPLQEQLEKLKEEKELAGKTALEKAEHKFQKELALVQKQLEEQKKAVEEREALAKTAQEQLRTERLTTRLSAELGKQKVIPQYLEKAVRLAMLDLKDVQIGDDGSVTASYGDHIEKPIADVVAAWVKDNENFLPAPSGGAGTRSSNGGPPPGKSYLDMTRDEIASLANQTEPNAAFRR